MHYYVVTGNTEKKNGYTGTARVGVVALSVEGAIETAKRHRNLTHVWTVSHQGKVDAFADGLSTVMFPPG